MECDALIDEFTGRNYAITFSVTFHITEAKDLAKKWNITEEHRFSQ